MSFAPTYECFVLGGNGNIRGCFNEKTYGKFFEFSINDTGFMTEEFPHKIWTLDNTWRLGRVLKTVAYVAVDEDEISIVVEKWAIKKSRLYPIPEMEFDDNGIIIRTFPM